MYCHSEDQGRKQSKSAPFGPANPRPGTPIRDPEPGLAEVKFAITPSWVAKP